MYLLAGEISRGGAITILTLSILAIILLLVNAVIVIMLHKMNKKLAKQQELTAIEQSAEQEVQTPAKTEENIN